MGEIGLLAGLLVVLAGTRLATWAGSRIPRSEPPILDPDLLTAIRELSPAGRVRLETFSGAASGVAVVVTGVCAKLWLSREDSSGRPPDVPVDLSEARETPIPAARARDLETGDPGFDAAFRVLGPPPLVYAILTDAVRMELVKLQHLVDEVIAEKGELRLLVEGFSGSGGEWLERLTTRALEVASGLGAPEDLCARLAQNALGSRYPGVRLRQLATLCREYPEDPIAREAFRAAAKDPDPEVRLRAGTALGEEGRGVLLALASSPGADDSIASRAVDVLGPALPVPEASKLLQRGPLLARSAVAALADLNRPDTEGPLIEALAAPDERARLAAAGALARVGTVAAVSSLDEAGHRWGGELDKVARRAIVEIQGRVVGAEAGQVSIAPESGAGDLSLADAREGEVAFPADDDLHKG